MARENIPSRAGSIMTNGRNPDPPPGYVDEFLSLFDQAPRLNAQHIQTAKPQNNFSSKNLLQKTPSIKSLEIETKSQPWRSGFWHRIPYSSALALSTVLICAVADALILWKSDGEEVESWAVSPSVLLAILSAVANTCLQFARSQGVVIAWWRKALTGGRLDDLHKYWEFGDSIIAAGKSGRAFNVVALATLIASMVVFDGPLLQRASTIVSKQSVRTVNVTATIAREIPYGYTALAVINGAQQLTVMNQTFAQIVNSYNRRDPIITDFEGCVGNCSGNVKAAGLAMNCSSSQVIWNNTHDLNVGNGDVFASTFTWFPANGTDGTYTMIGNPWINYDLMYAQGRIAPTWIGNTIQNGGDFSTQTDRGTCNGTLVRQRCTLLSATLDYPIVMVNNTISLVGNSSAYTVDHIQAVGNASEFMDQHDQNPMSFTTLGGMAMAAQNMFNSVANQQAGTIQMNGSLASQYAVFETEPSSFFMDQDACSINWVDPTTDIMNALNEIMFRTAVATSNTSKYSVLNYSITDTWTSFYEAYPVTWPVYPNDTGIPLPELITMQETSTINVFQSHYSYLAAALAVMILAILVVIPTFHGFWELGRDVSLNPLETAKAFNAEMLRGEGSNAPIRQLAKDFGNREVRYGEVMDGGSDPPRMAWASGNGGSGLGLRFRERKLELAHPSRVKQPSNQALFN